MVNHKQIAVVLTIGLVAVMMTSASTRVFAQHSEPDPIHTVDGITDLKSLAQVGKVLAGHDNPTQETIEAQLGKILGSHSGLGCSLRC